MGHFETVAVLSNVGIDGGLGVMSPSIDDLLDMNGIIGVTGSSSSDAFVERLERRDE